MAQPDPRRVARIVWGAQVGLDVVLAAAVALAPMPAAPELTWSMLTVAAGMSVAGAALSWLWAVRLRPVARPGAASPAPDQVALTRLIVGTSLCEGAALFALVGSLATQDLLLWLPFALSFGALVAQRPGDRHWARLGGTLARGAGRSPMVRE